MLILGAGLTGTAIGHFLSTQGHRVTLLDHPSWQDGYGTDADAPLPIVFGGYRETWRLLRTIENSTSAQANRTIPLAFRLPDGQVAVYQSPRLPGALQWVTGLFSFRGLPRDDRWKLLSYMEQIWEQALT
ncbi:MAG: NAD(P)-binding protein, partial [Nitrospira sp.]|nr:NAD(P)-binding protein [Nitrospira sp.]